MLKKCDISNDIVTVLKAHAKRALADFNCYCKMTSVVALDGVTLFLRLKYTIHSCKGMRHSPTYNWQDFLSAMAENWKKLKTSNVFSLFIVC